ncbi:phosphoribosylaminoimidazolesuccinocarboxamide synthase [Natranaerobius thermophilus]|uniref:Phosphoribosylaminoimidazole-succinocarboxamide synthase n=1 Tax=Natranaerobius thermophilus (strain ATCC BAA-1301 / DSM 18059 / JW/NM-WN-LF) TaxID=457570 RepID=B2A872_NATTJ|nr:phosphoribosylaminoimidazolesuccinocarboxamide synthase [Natranaerobius thermophilus]ACB84438.1 Phosphoribosylaminoimidazolesuccinocarboxamide synthase [Natranaerobius thermophilus JW/NM-WN-LF]
MKQIYEGKTKKVFLNEKGNLVLYFKDEVTGTGEDIDPGGNEVVGEIPEKGLSSLAVTKYFFDMLKEKGIPTHFIDASPEEGYMEVQQCEALGLEVICRVKAYGSFLRRYPEFTQNKELEHLNYLVEVTVKDDERGDPLINDEALIKLGILNNEELDSMKEITKSVAKIIETELNDKGLDLIDFKLEFGRVKDGKIIIIDEISGDSMRVFKDDKTVTQKELVEYLLK